MKSKNLVIVCSLLCIMLISSGCKQSQVKTEKLGLQNQQSIAIANEQNESGEHNQIGAVSPLEENSSVVNEPELEIDYLGLGNVSYRIKEVVATNDLSTVEINETELLRNTSVQDPVYLIISYELTNIDVPNDSPERNSSLANCFKIYVPAKNGTATPSLSLEPVYFNHAYNDGLQSEEKRYFEYTMPEIGKTMEMTQAWVLEADTIDQARTGKIQIYLLHNYAQKMLPLNFS